MQLLLLLKLFALHAIALGVCNYIIIIFLCSSVISWNYESEKNGERPPQRKKPSEINDSH